MKNNKLHIVFSFDGNRIAFQHILFIFKMYIIKETKSYHGCQRISRFSITHHN
jgi:hypothetical protein